MGSSDEALLAGLAAGDRDASAAFVRRFQGRVYGLARTIVGDSGTAEDVAQEAFVRAWRYAASYDARRGTVLTWLLTIVRNVALDRLRLRQPEPLDPELLASKLQLHDAPGARDEHSAVAEREQLREALTLLPAEQRRALLLAAGLRARSPSSRRYRSERPRRGSARRCAVFATGWRWPMSGDDRCEETRALLSELALGIADGAERARVLEHVADCAECRRELERQSAIADDLLVLAPQQEPPLGFELSVLRSIHALPARRRSMLRPLAVVAAVAAAVAITAGGMLVGFRDERRLADHYRATLAQAQGSYFGPVRLVDPAGRAGGVLFAYRGSPSWIMVTVALPYRASVERAELVDRRGRRIPLDPFALANGAWGGSIPVDLADVAAFHLVSGDGRSALVAEL